MKLNFFCGMLAMAVSPALFGAEPAIYSIKIGEFDVWMLVETRGPGRPNILLDLSAAQIDTYISGGSFGSETNTFLIRGKGRTVVVDTGFGGAIFSSMKELGVKPEDVDTVLLTHMHGDHIGGMAKDGKALFPKAKVLLAGKERAYWVDRQGNAGAKAALAPYSGRVETFDPGVLSAGGVEILPGIRATAAYGHTPGHTAFLVRDGGKELVIWGDLMHVQDVQFPLPSVSVTYDTDPKAAAVSREEYLSYAARNKVLIGGMHLRYPAVGTVVSEATGYRFVTE
ncbi:MAG: MBL fold metallo-hydrolase [Treponema sp.]|jgi:glyoxylase-like metal-dependent hydrolase (beta-lactamase superfamily II)|nr:MBL fold metallo-hydrolase [Treponema sp.]